MLQCCALSQHNHIIKQYAHALTKFLFLINSRYLAEVNHSGFFTFYNNFIRLYYADKTNTVHKNENCKEEKKSKMRKQEK